MDDIVIPNPVRTGVRCSWSLASADLVRGDMAVYERSLTKDKPLHELELVVITIANEKLMPNGSVVASHEVYPRDSHWGRFGWSFPVAMKPFVLDLARHASRNKANSSFAESNSS